MNKYLRTILLIAIVLVLQVYSMAGITNPWFEVMGCVAFGLVYAIIFNTMNIED